jgi:uncharacterized protein with ParB-like and HNH nuclease domain
VNVNISPIRDIFKTERCNLVPIYQRQYQWRKEQLASIWDDICTKIEDQRNKMGQQVYPHYLGALITAPAGTNAPGVTPASEIVDGQQRLTTLQILFAALNAKAHEVKDAALIRRLPSYIFNDPLAGDRDNPHAKYKVIPTPLDRQVFFSILENTRDAVIKQFSVYYHVSGNLKLKKTAEEKPALFAYEYFLKKIDEYIYDRESNDSEQEQDNAQNDEIENAETLSTSISTDTSPAIRLTELTDSLLANFQFVVITLGAEDDPQVIFETLNSGGVPLQAMDLVRNNLFIRARREGADLQQIYDDAWQNFSDEWWKQKAPRSRPELPRMDHFLAHLLTAEMGTPASMRELYASYRTFIDQTQFASVNDELELFRRHGAIYQTLQQEHDGADWIKRLGLKLLTWEMSSAYPVVFVVAQSELPEEEKAKIGTLLYSYVVRRQLCNLSTKSLSAVFARLAKEFRGAPSLQTVRDFFGGHELDSSKFPSDSDLKSSVLSMRAYGRISSSRLQDILWELELKSRDRFGENQNKPNILTVEHVLPRQWDESWPLADGATSNFSGNSPQALERNEKLHTLGNLTIVSGALNTALSNRPFKEKKERLFESSQLQLNRWIVQQHSWTEDTIKARAEVLAKQAIEIWPSIDG